MKANSRCRFFKASLYDRKKLHRLARDSYGGHICPWTNTVDEHRFHVAFTFHALSLVVASRRNNNNMP